MSRETRLSVWLYTLQDESDLQFFWEWVCESFSLACLGNFLVNQNNIIPLLDKLFLRFSLTLLCLFLLPMVTSFPHNLKAWLQPFSPCLTVNRAYDTYSRELSAVPYFALVPLLEYAPGSQIALTLSVSPGPSLVPVSAVLVKDRINGLGNLSDFLCDGWCVEFVRMHADELPTQFLSLQFFLPQ